MNTWLVVLLSLGAALSFAVSTNLKHSSASAAPLLPQFTVRSLGRFVAATITHPLWLLGLVADAVALVFQIFALHLGALAVVQPLLVCGLFFSLLLRRLTGASYRAADFGWALLLVAGLAGFLLVAGTASGSAVTVGSDRLPALIAAVAGLFVAGTSIWAARRLGPAVTSAALLGLAVGLLYAADAALLKSTTDRAVKGIGVLVTSWQLYAVIVVGVLGVFLCQLAYQAGPLTASLPTISAVDPLASVVIGVLIFDEHLRRGPWTGVSLAALVALLTVSAVQLGRREAQQ